VGLGHAGGTVAGETPQRFDRAGWPVGSRQARPSKSAAEQAILTSRQEQGRYIALTLEDEN